MGLFLLFSSFWFFLNKALLIATNSPAAPIIAFLIGDVIYSGNENLKVTDQRK